MKVEKYNRNIRLNNKIKTKDDWINYIIKNPTLYKQKWREMNDERKLPKFSINGDLLVIGCIYLVSINKFEGMQFILIDVMGEKAMIISKNKETKLTVYVTELIFDEEEEDNYNRAEELAGRRYREFIADKW